MKTFASLMMIVAVLAFTTGCEPEKKETPATKTGTEATKDAAKTGAEAVKTGTDAAKEAVKEPAKP